MVGWGKAMYRVYGMVISSPFDLSPLTPVQSPPNLEILHDRRDYTPAQHDTFTVSLKNGTLQVVIPPLAKAQIPRKGPIWITPYAGVSQPWLRRFVVDQAIPLALFHRGYLVLHGSAVARDGEALAILGFPRAGKSTLAAMLSHRGHTYVTDDVLVVENAKSHRPVVFGGPPYLKLIPEIYHSLFSGEDGMDTSLRKIERQMPDPGHAPIPLRAIVILERGERLRLRQMKVHDAVMACVRYSRGIQWCPPPMPERHLQQCVNLARQLPFYLLMRPRNMTYFAPALRLLENL